ncbi:GTPase Era [Thiohalomonas denitrificans]|uniref:GTPase Era n=1 Tax=Thiohalomonas denitrificans TaxID=415747 RepID=A0A1G5QDB7_9GAMM|nr:GTPase Era [Thiohalomonas denitrificans]SCZ59500.1 GTP-binding protein Era [Thiohalomonas denitrificans]
MVEVTRSGFVAIVGRPNVGKSTLMNHILGQKISITSHKPQTTRHRILGIKSEGDLQVIYVDTPGLHLQAKKAVNRYMNRAASSSLSDVDLILFVLEAGRWTDEDENVLLQLKNARAPVMAVVNKVDRLNEKNELLPYLAKLGQRHAFDEVLPVSALKGDNIGALEAVVEKRIPEGPALFPADQVTDRSERFLAAELVREKLMRNLGKEIPYALTVEIEQFREEEERLRINALIWVERDSQKRIVIGKGGRVLKEVGRQARLDMERLFGQHVFLELWVKVKEGWSDSERSLRNFGYRDEY